MSYRIEDFTETPDGHIYPFSVSPARAAATLRRLADELERASRPTLLERVTVVNRVAKDEWAAATLILAIVEPTSPEEPRSR